MPVPCEDQWRHRTASSPFHATVSFDGEDVVLGSNTVLRRLGGGKETVSLHVDAAHDRMVALLSIAGRGRLAKNLLLQLETALGDWRRGDRALAAIRLAFAPLPRLRNHEDAYRLFLAETALDAGLAPNELLRELGYFACIPLLKFDPNQPRVPAGSGAPSGRWTSGNASADAAGTASAPASSRPAPSRARPADTPHGFIPVFVGPELDDDLDEVIHDKDRRLGLSETDKERFEEGKPPRSPLPLPGPIFPRNPFAPGVAEPETGTAPVPSPKPTPGGTGLSSNVDSKDEGSVCPKPENDIPRGPNPNSDLFEYLMSIIVNPDNPTPKNSPLTPNVTSQAYFLPSPAPTGRTSFDDCKQMGAPPLTSIPGLRPGDMVEYKGPWWSWIIFNDWTSGFAEFAKQVKNQSDAVALEGRGRQVFYCMGDQATAKEAARLYSSYKSSHFLVCH